MNDVNSVDIESAKSISVYKLWDEAYTPTYGTEMSACFDLYAFLRDNDEVTVFTESNVKSKRKVIRNQIALYPHERMLVPTGLIFDIDECDSLRIHPRSGLSLKKGIILGNCEGIVDSDYVEQTYLMLLNASKQTFSVEDGMRVAQGEVVFNDIQRKFEITNNRPQIKSNRNGGLGSTGS